MWYIQSNIILYMRGIIYKIAKTYVIKWCLFIEHEMKSH